MKLCLLIVAAVTVVTCYALPVPKEEVFTVYPVNSALAQNTTELPVDAKPTVPVANGASAGESVSETPLEKKQEQPKTTLPEVEEKPVETPVKEESVKAAPGQVVETVAAPSKEVVETRPVDVPAPISEVGAYLITNPEDASEDEIVGEPDMVVIIEEPVLVTEITEPKLVSGVVEPTVVSGVVEPTLVSGVIEPKVVGGVVESTPVASETKSAEPKKDAVPTPVAFETKSAEPKKDTVPVEKATGDEKPKADAATAPKSVEPSQGETKVDTPAEAAKDEQKKAVEPEVKQAAADNKLEKLTEQPKVEAAPEATQARSAANDEPKVPAQPEQPKEASVKSVVEVAAEKVEVETKPVEEKPTESKVEVAPEVKSAVAAQVEAQAKLTALPANDLQPQTEGKAEEKPTKVRAVPIVEGLKVAQPVEAEPAITKIHVTVIQEEIPLRPESVAEKEPVAVAPAVAVSEEKKLEPVASVSVSPAKSEDDKPTTLATEVDAPVVKPVELKSAPVAAEKPAEVKADVASDKPAEVKSVESVAKSDSDAAAVEPKPVEAKKEEPSVKASLVEATTVVPSVTAEDATTVVVSSVSSEKPEQVVTVQAVPVTEKKPEEEVTTVAVDVKPEAPKPTEQLAKAATDGSSQPATTKSSDAVKETSKDQGNGDSTTVTAAPEADSTTLAPVTEPEPVPTPAKQKAKKQAPLDLKGYRQRLKQMEALTKKSGGNE